MRKILLIIVIAILLMGFGFVVVNGVNIANLNILGFSQIKEENQDIEEKNSKLRDLVKTEYPKAVSNLNSAEKSLQTKKEEYESQILLNSDSGSGYVATTEKYEIEYLWTKLGNYAKDNGVELKIDLTNSSVGTGFYKLNFTATGSYVGITDFIYAIENDSKLGFKIDNFSMTQNQSTSNSKDNKADTNTPSGDVKATFSCDEIAININSIEQNTSSQSKQTSETDEKTNTTQDTQSNNTTNTTTKNTTSNSTKNQTQADIIDNY